MFPTDGFDWNARVKSDWHKIVIDSHAVMYIDPRYQRLIKKYLGIKESDIDFTTPDIIKTSELLDYYLNLDDEV